MPMREDCRHYESRQYDDDRETARFCVLDLAPEAPWRCPDDCPSYERSVNDGSFETASLETTPVEDEPEGSSEDIIGVLQDAEQIVDDAEERVIADLDGPRTPRRRGWRFWRKDPPDDGDFHLSQR